MTKGTIPALLYGLVSALPLSIALLWPGGLLFWILVPLPLFVSGLSMGAAAAVLSAAAAQGALCLLLLIRVLQATGDFGGALLEAIGLFIGMSVMLGAPVVVLVRQALLSRNAGDGKTEWYPPGLLVTWLTTIGLALLVFSVGSILLFGGAGGGIEATVSGQLHDVLKAMLAERPEEELRNFAATAARVSLGLGLDGWLLVLAVNGVLAQGLLGRSGRNLRPAPKLGDLSLPSWLGLVLAGTALAGILARGDLAFLANSLALVLLLPYFFAGLAVVHAICQRFKARMALLVLFYVVLVLATWPAIFVVAAGLLDQIFGLRRRLTAAATEREKE